MSSRDEALVTPLVMKWAREAAGYDSIAAASKLNRPVEDIEGWEDGSLRPSLAQARKAAEVYHRSLAVFYLPDPPQDFDTLRDFRRLPMDLDPELSPALTLLIRQVQNRQEWMLEKLSEEGTEGLPFVGSSKLRTPPDQVADSIRKTLGISFDKQMKCHTRREALNLWIERSERAGIFVCRQGSVGRDAIECEEVRGFVLANKLAPFIFINTNDATVAQMFTLVHELAHIWINKPGISNMLSKGRLLERDSDQIEVYCNQVAALALLPPDNFDSLWEQASKEGDIDDRIEKVAERIKLSEEVVARRLLENRVISKQKYHQSRSYYSARWQKVKEEEKKKNRQNKGGPSPHLMKVLSNGRAFTHTVLSSYHTGRVSGSFASHLLSAKVNNFSKMAVHASVAIGRSRGMEGTR